MLGHILPEEPWSPPEAREVLIQYEKGIVAYSKLPLIAAKIPCLQLDGFEASVR